MDSDDDICTPPDILELATKVWPSSSRPSEQVSVYTTETSAATAKLDVYSQIASNLAEKITSPIYRFLGIRNSTTSAPSTKKPWQYIEILDDIPDDVTAVKPINNDISNEKDVEELSEEAKKKTDKKPEKITLYSSNLPTKLNLEANDTINEVSDDDDDEPFGFDDDDDEAKDTPRNESFIILVLEWFANIRQLILGAWESIFGPGAIISHDTPTDTNNDSN